MAIKVEIPSPLQPFTELQPTIDLNARTVGEALAQLSSRYEGLRKHLFTEAGKLRTFVNLYLNDEDVRFLAREATPLEDDDVLAIIPTIAGGFGL
ncbi:MAG: MoaD/ThiS family protein [Terriglobia bacterium]